MSYGRFGVREICDVVFRPLSSIDIGKQHFDAMQPCLYLDSATASSLESSASTVYAQGGKGNPRLIAWEGEKTVTFNIEDALMSTVSFAMLSGAGVVEGSDDDEQYIYMHTTYELPVKAATKGDVTVLYAELDSVTRNNDHVFVAKEAPVYAVVLNEVGGVKNYLSAVKTPEIGYGARGDFENATQLYDKNGDIVELMEKADESIYFVLNSYSNLHDNVSAEERPTSVYGALVQAGDIVRIDCYTRHGNGATQINIDAESFGGYYYIEANTLFRDEATGRDFPAEFVIPRGKIQSNFTFSMASSGDPSTFNFVIDAFPAYTAFTKTKKVLAQLNVLDVKESAAHNYPDQSIRGHQQRSLDGSGDLDVFGQGTDKTNTDDNNHNGHGWWGSSIFANAEAVNAPEWAPGHTGMPAGENAAEEGNAEEQPQG